MEKMKKERQPIMVLFFLLMDAVNLVNLTIDYKNFSFVNSWKNLEFVPCVEKAMQEEA